MSVYVARGLWQKAQAALVVLDASWDVAVKERNEARDLYDAADLVR